MLETGNVLDRFHETELQEHLVSLTGIKLMSRALLRQDMYDPISGITISVWSGATGTAADRLAH